MIYLLFLSALSLNKVRLSDCNSVYPMSPGYLKLAMHTIGTSHASINVLRVVSRVKFFVLRFSFPFPFERCSFVPLSITCLHVKGDISIHCNLPSYDLRTL
ncbi:hypothetical protein PMIN02_004420 [Paraphaeosphaeria minitans]